jgi:hypothetical protein
VWHGQKSWNGVAILARGAEPVETRRGLPGDPDDTHSRYIEAAIGGMVVGCLYLPNGNPVPGPKFDYKLRWFERLTGYAKSLLDSGAPAVLAGDFNVMPTELDVYADLEFERPSGSWRFSHTGSAGRPATARPCRPATVFDFRRSHARVRAHALTGEVLGLLPAGRPAPGRAPPRAIDYSCGLILFKAPAAFKANAPTLSASPWRSAHSS